MRRRGPTSGTKRESGEISITDVLIRIPASDGLLKPAAGAGSIRNRSKSHNALQKFNKIVIWTIRTNFFNELVRPGGGERRAQNSVIPMLALIQAIPVAPPPLHVPIAYATTRAAN